MKKVTLHTINLNSWVKTRDELTPVDGEFPPSMLNGVGKEFSFIMANHEDPEKIQKALSEIVQTLQNSIPDFALEISRENRLSNFIQEGEYQTDEVVSILQGMPDQQFTVDLKEKC